MNTLYEHMCRRHMAIIKCKMQRTTQAHGSFKIQYMLQPGA